jgi:hypothetical protein
VKLSLRGPASSIRVGEKWARLSDLLSKKSQGGPEHNTRLHERRKVHEPYPLKKLMNRPRTLQNSQASSATNRPTHLSDGWH